jgi:hypothetical protein
MFPFSTLTVTIPDERVARSSDCVKVALDINQLMYDCLRDRLRRGYTTELLSRGVQVKSYRSLADSQYDAGFQRGFSRGRPFQAVKFSGRHEDLVFGIVTMHPQHVSMKIVGQNTTLSQRRFSVFGPVRALDRRRNPKKGRLSSSPIERQSDLNRRMLRAVTQPDIIFVLKFETDRFFTGKLPHARIGVDTMNKISWALGD